MSAAETMNAAIGRWIGEARLRPDGAALLQAKVGWIEKQNGELFRYAQRDEAPPKHLVGLTTYDLIEGRLRLVSAVAEIEGVSQ